ncbi:MAG: hypothetical protein QW228_05605 [Candidatus Aenigmatarchaeota archaeon]
MLGLNLIALYYIISRPVQSAAGLFNRGAKGVGKVLDLWTDALRKLSEFRVVDKSMGPIAALTVYAIFLTVVAYIFAFIVLTIIIALICAGLGKLFEYLAKKIEKKLQEEENRKKNVQS